MLSEHRSKLVVTVVLLVMAVAAWAARQDAGAVDSGSKFTTLPGETKPMGNGTIWSWVKTDALGQPTSVGVSFTESALRSRSQEPVESCCDGGTALALPAGVGHLPFTHIVVNWNPQGHEPKGIYDVPHFDFHFYTISPAARDAITATEADTDKINKAPDAKYLPAGYIMAPRSGIVKMGTHWIDPASPEFHGQPFTRTFLYGSYDGAVAFVEPMISKAYLETHPDVTTPIKTPAALVAEGAVFPTEYSVKYDSDAKTFTLALEHMTQR
jgi:hypothetical protein